MNSVEQTASKLYSAYCAAVGGIAFNGDPLPDWETFRADPEKQKQSDAWVAAAKAGNPPIIETAERLAERFGMVVAVSYDGGSEGRRRFCISGGEHMSGGIAHPKQWACAWKERLDEAEAEFVKLREQAAKIDPLAELKRAAAAAGMSLVPAEASQTAAA